MEAKMKNLLKEANQLCALIFGFTYVFAKRRTFTVGLIIVSISAILFSIRWGFVCLNINTMQHVHKVCLKVANGLSVGNLCSALCLSRDVSTLSCRNFHGKEVVFAGTWKDYDIIFKSPMKTSNVSSIFLLDMLKTGNYPTELEFKDMVKSNVKNKFNININDVDTTKMMYLNNKGKKITKRHVEMQNVWSLLQDNEYLALTLYEKFDIFPKLMGSCGSLFAVQRLDSISGYAHIFNLYDNKEEWLRRVKTAVMILDLLNDLESKVPEPLHLCDVKMNHFGITTNLHKIKYLDLDAVHPRSVVNKLTGDGSPCFQHSDCDFVDCRSFCNQITLKCQHDVANDNFQVVCEKIFLGWVMSGRVLLPGLLLGPFTPRILLSLLQRCANPLNEEGIPRAKVSKYVRKRLYELLIHLT